MASANKLTMYYHEESTRLFLEEKMQKSGSRYLLSLVERERMNIQENNNESKESDALTPVMIFRPFNQGSDYVTSGWVSFSAFDKFKEIGREKGNGKEISSRRRELKLLRREILKKIIFDYENIITRETGGVNEYGVFVIVVNYVICNYHDFEGNEVNFHGEFSAEWTLIHVDRGLWDRYQGKYDFSKINYLRHQDVLVHKKGMAFSLIQKSLGRDKVGAYFIPVKKDSLSFEKFSENRCGPLLFGGEIDQINARVDIKRMNETRVKKILSANKKLETGRNVWD